MFKNMRLVILFDMLLNPSFKMATSFTNVARTTAISTTILHVNIKSCKVFTLYYIAHS